MFDLGIINGMVYLDGDFVKINVYISGEKIVKLSDQEEECKEIYDANDKLVMPGLIDPHVHFELGVGEYQSVDDFYQGSVSAAFGGITTFIDFLDPVDKGGEVKKAFADRKKRAEKSILDYTFHATVKNPVEEVNKIVEEMKELGLNSVKLFTTYSDSGRRTYSSEIKELLERSKEENFIVLAHIEKDDLIVLKDEFEVKDLPVSRPKEAELEAAIEIADLVKETGGNLYMVHLSCGDTLQELILDYKDIIGKNFMIESCPHYFYLDDSLYAKEDGYKYTMAPPLRDFESRKTLLVNFDRIDSIGTDHCSYTLEKKKGKSLVKTPMGIGAVEHSFDLMYTLYGDRAIKKMSENPAKIFGLYPEKGSLQEGTDADIMIYDPSKKHVIGEDHSAAGYSVFEGEEVDGQVEATILRGKFVVRDGQLCEVSGGRFLGKK